jgi:hypothetical protein
MKTKILSGLICCLGIFSANAQTITAPVGQSLTVTNPIDITVSGGNINVPNDGSFKIGGTSFIKAGPSYSIMLGKFAGNNTLTGQTNILVGASAGQNLTNGEYDVFVGTDAGASTTTGNNNMFLGYRAGNANVGGSNNSFFGTYAGKNNISGSENFFMGYNSGAGNIAGTQNVYVCWWNKWWDNDFRIKYGNDWI